MADRRLLFIVLDTSVLDDDPRMHSARVRLLLEGCSNLGARVLLPAVVTQELRRRTTEKINTHIRNVEDACGRLARLAGDDVFPKPDPLALKRLVESIQHWYGDHWFYDEEAPNDPTIVVAKHPVVSHAHLAASAVHRRRPFKKDGQGYQDALIWHTVLDIIDSNPAYRVAFITQNSADFLDDEKKGLHSDLLQDLHSRGAADRVEAFVTLDDFNRVRVLPTLKPEVRLRFDVEKPTADAGRAIRTWMISEGPQLELFHLVETAVEHDLIDETTDRLVASPRVTAVHHVRSRRAHDLGSDAVLLGIDVECRIEFELEFPSKPYQYREGSRAPLLTGVFPHRVHRYLEDVTVSMSLVVQKRDLTVIAADVTGVQGRHGAMEIEEEEEEEDEKLEGAE